jgi:hypothetical protein
VRFSKQVAIAERARHFSFELALRYSWLSLIVSCVSACSSGPEHEATPSPRPASEIGINLASISYFATQTPSSDVFRNRDVWATTDGITWDTGLADSVPIDADGYPLEIPFEGQTMRTSVFQPFEGGTFTLTWKGDGELTVLAPGLEIQSHASRSIVFSTTRSVQDPIFVRIDRSNEVDHVHDIRLYASGSYDTAFDSALKGFRVLRFMDWGATNGNPVSTWSERTTALAAQGTTRGASIEMMIESANEVHAHMWYSVPPMADDDFVERAAELIRSTLAPDLKVYVEYANENWNPVFPQVAWEAQQGLALGLNEGSAADDGEDAQRYDAGLKFSVQRAALVHSTFRRVLGASRVVAVLGGQSASSALNDQLLSAFDDTRINPFGGRPDALAVAPYFGRVYSPSDGTEDLSVDDLLDDTEAQIETSVGEDTRANHEVASAHHVDLIAYEAGQHLLAIGGLENDKAFIERLLAANRDPRMGELYRKAHAMWLESGGGLAIYYNSCEQWSKFGTWGALEYQNQPLSEAPKMAALRALARGK